MAHLFSLLRARIPEAGGLSYRRNISENRYRQSQPFEERLKRATNNSNCRLTIQRPAFHEGPPQGSYFILSPSHLLRGPVTI